MASLLRRLTASAARRGCVLPGLVALALFVLASCNRAAYQFRPSTAYLATERPAPSVPVPAALAATADTLSPAACPRPAAPARRPTQKLQPPKKPLSQRRLVPWARPLAAKLITKHLARRAASLAPARQQSAGGISSTSIVGLSLMGIGLIGLLVGASISTNLVGAILGVYLMLLGSIAIVVGLILLFIGLLANE
jgi:hypothetical protein